MHRRPAPRVFSLSVILVLVAVLAGACKDSQPPASTATPDVTATSSDTPTPQPTATPQPLPPAAPITWRQCGGFECATYAVPLNYARPGDGDIQLALVRQRARSPSTRTGSLFVNNGGPGGVATEFLRAWAPSLTGALRDQFDIIAFDPRGVGESSALVCHEGLQAFIALDPTPDSPEEWQKLETGTKAFNDQCGLKAPSLLPHLGTLNVVRDMDRIREALAEETITYFGYSYGTEIGALYADLFPGRVRAMVLDGALDLSLPADQFNLEQGMGFEAALARYFADCRQSRCISANPDDPQAALRELLRRADAAPIPAPGADRPAGEAEVTVAMFQSLYRRSSWARFTSAVNAAFAGNATAIMALADEYLNKRADGSYGNFTESFFAVSCLDRAHVRDVKHYMDLAPKFAVQAPNVGFVFATSGVSCALWPATPTPVHTPRGRGAPPLIVIGTTGDPATPYKWAVSLSQQLESAVLLTNDGEGHTAYRTGVTCIDSAVNDYLLTLKPPTAGTKCGSAGIAPVPPVP